MGATTRITRDVSRFAFLQGWGNVLVLLQHRGVVVAAALLAGSRAETGYAAVAAGVAIAVTYVIWQLFTVTMPRFAAMATADTEAALAAFRKVADLALLVAAPIALVGAVLTPPLLPLLFGDEFSPARRAFAPALAAVPIAALVGVVGSAAALQLRPGARLLTTGAGAITFVVAATALVPAFDAAGATGALLAGTAAAALTGMLLFRGLVDPRLVGFAFVASAVVLGVGLVR